MSIYNSVLLLKDDVERYECLCRAYEELKDVDHKIKEHILSSNKFKCDRVFVDMNNGSSFVKDVSFDRFICYEDSIRYRDEVLSEYARMGYSFCHSPISDLKTKVCDAKKNILKKAKNMTGVDPFPLNEEEEFIYIGFIVSLCFEFFKRGGKNG